MALSYSASGLHDDSLGFILGSMKRRSDFLYALLLLVGTLFASQLSFASQPTIEAIGPIKAAVPEAIKAAIAENGFRVSVDGGILAEIWMAKAPVSEKNGSDSALYPDFANGGFYGVVTFPKGAGDFRGQKIPAGTYTLRYQLLPGDGNHMGVAPNPDFFLLVPVDVDPGPDKKIPYPALVKLSAKASGTAHPAAFSLATAGEKSTTAAVNDQGFVVATIPLKSGGSENKVGMIVKGSAEQ